MSDARKRILREILASPGIHKSDLCRRTSLAWGTIGYHLQVLRRQGKISTLRVGSRLYISPSTVHHNDAYAYAALRQDDAQQLLRRVNQGPCGMLEAATHLNLSRKIVRRHANMLIDSGLLSRDQGPRGKLVMTLKGRRVLREHRTLTADADHHGGWGPFRQE